MILRDAAHYLKKLARGFRSIAIVGPRQSGKSTLCKMVFPKKPYVSLENPDIREFAEDDPRYFLAQYPKGAILDEIQRVPVLFSYLQEVLDNTRSEGLFILTGSNNFLFQENITQSLAGRIGYLELLPLSIKEIKNAQKLDTGYIHHLFTGGYPELVDKGRINPESWYSNYISTYIERDVRQLKNIGKLSLFLKFIRLCAGRTGQILNLTSIGNDCGIDQKTVASWLSILQNSYILFLLEPYFKNFNKRIVKSPKLYFYDTGLVCSMLGLENKKQLINHPMTGHLFENFIIADQLKNRFNKGLKSNLFYWRDKTGNEVDLLADEAGYLTAIEIKAGSTFSNDFVKGLSYFESLQETKIRKLLIYGGKEIQERESGLMIRPWDAV